ncbi:hypothetical protein E5S69_14595 [Cupriavidus necator]|uniref:hypothetical protein n=1 Tax=Cupriavidus necator TaxID=106590 RepID=UPI00148FB6F5|nr:hypothetical protein [Cupriavidus necator]NOV24736.1 hypothetical protein [Cupriavidus necator]
MLEVEQGVRPPKSKLPRSWRRDAIAHRFGNEIVRIHDNVRFDFMDVNTSELPYEEAQKRRADIARRFAPIRHLVNERNFMAVVADKKIRPALIKKAVAESGIDEATIRHNLTTYWWFGCDKTAMIPLHARKGGPDVGRRGYGKAKTGPRPAAYENSGNQIDLGIQCSPLHVRMIHRAVEKYVMDEGYSFRRAWEKARETVFVGRTRVEGEIVESPWDIRLTPSFSQFYRIGSEYLDDEDRRKRFVGVEDARNKLSARRGHATDILNHSKQVLLMDGTELQVYLVKDTNDFSPIGKATGLFGICARSGALVGQHVWPNQESSDAYRYCLFSAMSEKDELAKEYGLVSCEGLPKGDWDSVFIDRGPAISGEFEENVVKSLRMSRELAEVYRGQAKGLIESFNAYLKSEIAAQVPGAYTRRLRTRDKRRREEAKESAVLTLGELKKCVILAIEKYNLYSDATSYYTTKMRDRRVPLHRAGILEYIQKRRRGDGRTSWTKEELLVKLLPFVRRTNREGFVAFGSSQYSSTELRTTWERAPNLLKNNKVVNPMVWVAPVPGTTNVLVWRKDDGSISWLDISKRDRERYGHMTQQERKFVARPTDIARAQASMQRRRPNSKVRKEQAAALKDHARRRQAAKIPALAMSGVNENKKQAIAKSDEMLGQKVMEVLGRPGVQPSTRPDESWTLVDEGSHEDSEDLTGFFDARFED